MKKRRGRQNYRWPSIFLPFSSSSPSIDPFGVSSIAPAFSSFRLSFLAYKSLSERLDETYLPERIGFLVSTRAQRKNGERWPVMRFRCPRETRPLFPCFSLRSLIASGSERSCVLARAIGNAADRKTEARANPRQLCLDRRATPINLAGPIFRRRYFIPGGILLPLSPRSFPDRQQRA